MMAEVPLLSKEAPPGLHFTPLHKMLRFTEATTEKGKVKKVPFDSDAFLEVKHQGKKNLGRDRAAEKTTTVFRGFIF